MKKVSAILSICLLVIFCSFLCLFRNLEVFNYRIDILQKMDDAITKDVSCGLNLDSSKKWRLQKYDEVTYYQMVLEFWKPLDSFYQDKSFLK